MSLPRLVSSFCLVCLISCGSSSSGHTGPVGQPEPSAALTGSPKGQRKPGVNGTLFQAYHWYTPADGRLWEQLTQQAQSLSDKGFTALWLPPAYKSAGGGNDVGYAVYDAYDLGEFQQKGSRRTKYGDKDQYLKLIQTAQAAGLDVFADIVMNHRMGADRTESVTAVEVDPKNRSKDVSSGYNIQAWTLFDFSGRGDRYSNFRWNWSHFTGVDWDQQTQQRGRIYRFNAPGKGWASEVSKEFGNYDYLIGADVDFYNSEVVAEMKTWGSWYQKIADLDGFRLDAVKHMKSGFLREWVDHVRTVSGKELFTVAEYWDPSIDVLLDYLSEQDHSLFDVPLHMNFFKAAQARGSYNMATLLDDTLLERAPTSAVTFVDNHDTQPLQALQSPVADWFKPLAYALILLRAEGYPSVFSADYTGASYENIRIPAITATLDVLLKARRDYAYGPQRSYFDAADIVGWTRSGDDQHPSGLAVVLSDNGAGTKRMEVGPGFAGTCFKNTIEPNLPCVTIDNEGFGVFPVNAKSFSIWVGP
ncbi:MAG TPA: alpha-amylase [Oligoflexus sp.]|uniref:alpha-amylase n=1 Tax=Oligoflexus sp. TaxID=1971216 RepID=UPI002D51E2D1|nr:alpha-amylase [Oligoflexus sp.]HYX37939.1 alpha-amylase [Oligoflexus sp.]